MKGSEKVFLTGCAIAPILGFFPFETHTTLMRVIDFVGGSQRSDTVSIQPLGIFDHVFDFLNGWLSILTAILFAVGVFRLRHLVRNCSEAKPSPFMVLLFFAGGISHFLIPHLIPFFFAIVTLAILANVREKWVDNCKTSAATSA